MNKFFRKLFHIYAGEEANAILFAFLGFLWALGVTLGLKFADALFLLHVGADSLPIVYIITAMLMMVLATFLLKAFNSISADKIFSSILAAGILFYSLVYFYFLFDTSLAHSLWFILRIFGSLIFSISITCYWTFVDQYYHLQDAKRLFSLFSSAVFLGIATTGIIMRTGYIEFQHIVLLIVALFSLAILWIRRIVAKVQPIYDETVIESGGEQEEGSFSYLIQSIFSSRFTLLMMVGNFLAYVLLVITEFSYLSAFDAYFDPGINLVPSGEEQNAKLTQFLGECLTGVSIFNLLFGLFIYSRLVRRFGISNLVLFTPAVLVLNFAGWSFVDALIFPVIGFFVVEGMYYVIDDNNFTLLLNAVPHKLKYRIRLVIESFFEPIGMLVSSILISTIPVNSKILGLVLATCALGIALILKRRYVKAIFQNLADNAIHFQRTLREWFHALSPNKQKKTQRRLLAILQVGDEAAQAFAIESILEIADNAAISKLMPLLDDLDDKIKIHFIRLISTTPFAMHHKVIDHANFWLVNSSNHLLKGEIEFYLAKWNLLPQHTALNNIKSQDLLRYGAAVLALYNTVEEHSTAVANLNLLLHSDDEMKLGLGIDILTAVAEPIDLDRFLPYLQRASVPIQRKAALALVKTITPEARQLAPLLLKLLHDTSDSELRQSYLKAIGKLNDPFLVKQVISSCTHFRPSERRLAENIIFKWGKATVPNLLDIVKDQRMHDRCRVLASKVLGRLDLEILRECLPEVIEEESDRAAFYFYYYHTVQREHPEHDLKLLQDDLLSSYHSVLDFIIQLLGIAGESENSELLSYSLRSPNPKVRSQVIETLERTCKPTLFRSVYPLIADQPDAEKAQVYLRAGHEPLSLEQLLDRMSISSIEGDQIVAIALKYRLDLPSWRESLKRQLAKPNEMLHHFAYELLE